jgi:hypothetical protein
MISFVHLHTPEMGKCWGGRGSSGAVSLNFVGNEYKDKQCVMRYEIPRLNKFSVTAVMLKRTSACPGQAVKT